MKITCNLNFIYSNKNNAELVFNSLEIDNENYLKSELKDTTIKYNIRSEKLGSFLQTVDDLVASEIVVEKIIGKIK